MILNAAVRIIVTIPRHDTENITLRANELHFLPIKSIIEFKICLLAHKYLLSGELRYFKNLLQPVPTSRLRSSISKYQISMDPSFCQSAPRLYNYLPLDLRTIDNLFNLRRNCIIIVVVFPLRTMVAMMGTFCELLEL